MRENSYATVAVYRPSDRTWWAGRVDPDVMGDATREHDALVADLRERGAPVTGDDVTQPTLVVRDPSGRFPRGCSTNSHFDDHDRAHTDPHADCAHGRAMDRVLAVLRTTRDLAAGQ